MSDSANSEELSKGGRANPGRPFILVLWYVLMAVCGLGFGLIGDHRPLGDNLLFRPLIMFAAVAAIALLALRVAFARPVQEVIPDRKLAYGFAIGLALFLAGNYLSAHVRLFAH